MMKLPAILSVLGLSLATLLAQNAPVDWQTLATEFSKDSVAATQKYQDTMITVTGPVSQIAGGDMTVDQPSVAVTLSKPDGPGPDVKCLFEPEDLEPGMEIHVNGDGSEAILRRKDESPVAQRLDMAGEVVSSQSFVMTGQQVTVTGAFLGYEAGDIVLRHCKLAGGASQ